MFFRRKGPERTNGIIDLYPLHFAPPDRWLQFGEERVWKISLHGQRDEIGQISYRNGESFAIYYFGHIGYHVDPPFQGHGYAFQACELIRDVIAKDGKSSVVITCDPDNIPSRKTCEKLGSCLERIVDVPIRLRERYDISSIKCRYIWRIE